METTDNSGAVPLNQARKDLAAAISRYTKLERMVARNREIVENARRLHTQTLDSLSVAEAGQLENRRQRRESIRNAAKNGTAALERSNGNSAAAVLAAQDDVAAAAEALGDAKENLAQSEQELERQNAQIALAADEVIRSDCQFALFAEAGRLQAALVEKRVALWYCLRNKLVPIDLEQQVHQFLRSRTEMPGSPGTPLREGSRAAEGDREFVDWQSHPVCHAYQTVRAELQWNASARLPQSAS